MEIQRDEGSLQGAGFGTPLPNEVVFRDNTENEESKTKAVIILDDEERFSFHGQTGFTEEEKSIFQKSGYLKLQEAIPVVPKRMAVACLILNCLFPGLGTAVGAFASLICPCEQYMADRWLEVLLLNISAAICQLATTVYFFIGYFWGIWWAIQMIQRAPPRAHEKTFSISVAKRKKQSYVEKSEKPMQAKYIAGAV